MLLANRFSFLPFLLWVEPENGTGRKEAQRRSQTWIRKRFDCRCAASTYSPSTREAETTRKVCFDYIIRLCLKKSRNKTKTKDCWGSSGVNTCSSMCEALGLTLPITTKKKKKETNSIISGHMVCTSTHSGLVATLFILSSLHFPTKSHPFCFIGIEW